MNWRRLLVRSDSTIASMARRDEVPLQVEDLLEEIRDNPETDDLEAIRDLAEDIEVLREWTKLGQF